MIRNSFWLLAAAGCCGMALAQVPGSFTTTGAMSAARAFHTATLLANGKVLIAGGRSASGPGALATAELYDPSTGRFSATGSMSMPRVSHTATLLPDGRVLIAGGDSGAGTAELYDPETGTFTPRGQMSAARAGHSATLLNNGKVLIVGPEPGALAELYDPDTGSFAPAGNTTPCSPRATLLSNGKVLLAQGSGMECDDSDYPAVQLYDSVAGVFSSIPWTPGTYSVAGSANLLPNGRVLITTEGVECFFGGSDVLYDPSNSAFTPVARLKSGCLPSGTMLSDGSVVIAGGQFAGPVAVIYDPASGVFSRTGDMGTERWAHTATLLNDGTVLMSGGAHAVGNGLDLSTYVCCVPAASAELYHPSVMKPAAQLLSLSGDGKGAGAIQHASTYGVVSDQSPATPTEILTIYFTGLIDGSVIPPQVAIGGRMADVLWFGKTPGYPGLNQINVRVPGGIAPGSAVPVRLVYLNRPSNEVTIAVQ